MSAGSSIGIVVLLTAASIILLVIGLVLHRKRLLRSRAAAIGWAVLTILPLFVGGWLVFIQR